MWAQAAYFRSLLAAESEQLDADLEQSRAQLREATENEKNEKVVGLRTKSRARREVRELEARERELHRIIAALDRRFSAAWQRG